MSFSDRGKVENSSILAEIVKRSQLSPNHPAAKDLSRELSYAELVDDASRVAAGLRSFGVSEGDRVAIYMPNSVDFLIATLACMWIGAAFVPLAVTDPQSRLATVIADLSPAIVIRSGDNDGTSEVAALNEAPIVAIDELRIGGPTVTESSDALSKVAYMIYTSGTTGKPKGVQIGNTAFSAAVNSTAMALELDSNTVTLCVSPFHFDGSYANLFTTLISGGTVVIRPRESLLYPRTFFQAIEQEGITYAGFTPSYLRLLLASRRISNLESSTLKVIALGGEVISAAELQSLWFHAPSIRVFNRYGPTETTIAVTDVELTPDSIRSGTVTVGRPHPGVSFVLVDERGSIIHQANKVGELYIGGVQLMSGYYLDPRLTNDVLRRDVVPGEILYRTGDLMYRDASKQFFYVDRADRIVKRSGVRISLVELSALVSRVEGVAAAACLTFEHDGELGIATFVVADSEMSDVELRRAAREFVPETMLPDVIQQVPRLPLNRSNQLDENQLLADAQLRPYDPNTTRE